MRPCAASRARRVILATNIAETSLTVPGVSAVVDTGLVKVARYDADRGLDALVTERVTLDSADQRAGRAARLGPGLVRRLWDARDRLRPTREPDIAGSTWPGRCSTCSPGAPVRTRSSGSRRRRQRPWRPRSPCCAASGAVTGSDDAVVITALGRRLQRLPVHVRLARILVEGGGAPQVAAACALLAEGRRRRGRPRPRARAPPRRCDLLADLDRFAQQPPHVRRLADELARLAHGAGAAITAGATLAS